MSHPDASRTHYPSTTTRSKYSDLETAGTTSAAARALASWDARQQVLAAFSAGLHFLFLFLYGPFLLLANVWVADHSASPPWLVRASSVLALLQPVGMACDVINQSVNIATLADGPKSGALGFHLACSILHLLILTPAALLALVFVVWIRVSGRQNQTAVSAEGGADNMALSKS